MIPVVCLPADVPFKRLFADHIVVGRPCVLTAAADGWPARSRWTTEFLCERYGDVLVNFVEANSGDRSLRPLRDYFMIPAACRSRFYVCDWDFRKRQSELLDDIGKILHFDIDWIDAIPPAQRPDLMWIYIGHANNLRQEPDAAIPLVRIRGGGHGQPRSLLRQHPFTARI